MIKISISWKSVLLFWAIGVGLWAIATFADVLLVLFTAILLATFISPMVGALNRRGIPRWLATLFVYFDILVVLGVVAYLAAPLVIDETAALVTQLPAMSASIYKYLAGLPGFKAVSGLLPSSTDLTTTMIGQLGLLAESLRGLFLTVTTLVISTLVVLVVAYFFTVDDQLLVRAVHVLVPAAHRDRTLAILRASGGRMRGWVVGQLIVTVYFVVVFSLGLWIIGVPYALSLGFIAGFLEIIPFIGGAMGAVLAMLVALTKDPLSAVWVLVLHLIVSNLEAHVIIPYVYGRSFRLHPVLVILALLLGVQLFGIIGALLAVPAAAAIQVVVEDLYVRDVVHPDETSRRRRGGPLTR